MIGFDFDNHDLGIDGPLDDAIVECVECGDDIVEGQGHWLLMDDTRVCVECHDEIYGGIQ